MKTEMTQATETVVVGPEERAALLARGEVATVGEQDPVGDSEEESMYKIGEVICTKRGNVGTVTSIREGWVWVRWRSIDGERRPEVPFCRA